MRYESEILYDLMKRDGLLNPPQNNLPYESELKEKYVNDVVGAYPKLQDYRSEWLNYVLEDGNIGEFPYFTLTDVTNATIDNVVPYAYKSAILKGDTKFINEDGVEQADKTIFHSCYFEQGTIGGSIGSETTKTASTIRIRTINPLSLEIGSYSITVISGYEVYAKIINSTTNKGIRQAGFASSISFNITDSSIQKVYIVFKKSDNTNITTDEVEGIVSSSTVPELTSLSLVSVQMPVLTTSNEDGTKSNILTVNEEVELRGIGNVKDELNLLTGEISNNFNKITIDGTKNWYKSSNETELTVRYRCDNIGVSILKENICICDSYNVGSNTTGDDLVVTFSGTMLTYRVLKSKFPTLKDFKKWLNDNPHTFIYQTKKSIKTVDLTITNQNGESLSKITPIEGTMHLSTSSDTIPPLFNGEIPVEAIEQNLASFADLEGVEHDG